MKKVVIIILVVFAVIMVVILVARPGGHKNEVSAPGFVKVLGSLAPHTDVKAADMAGLDCWDNGGVLTDLPNATCQMQLPKGANRLKICLAQGTLATLRIKGDKYGPQEFDPTKIACGTGGESFDLYDDNSRLGVVCGPTEQCVLRLQ